MHPTTGVHPKALEIPEHGLASLRGPVQIGIPDPPDRLLVAMHLIQQGGGTSQMLLGSRLHLPGDSQLFTEQSILLNGGDQDSSREDDDPQHDKQPSGIHCTHNGAQSTRIAAISSSHRASIGEPAQIRPLSAAPSTRLIESARNRCSGGRFSPHGRNSPRIGLSSGGESIWQVDWNPQERERSDRFPVDRSSLFGGGQPPDHARWEKASSS